MKEITSVKKSIEIQASPEKVWQALTIPSIRNQWETKSCEIDLVIGGRMYLDYGWNVTYEGIITEIEVNKRLVLEGDDKQLTIWSIESHAQGSTVTIEYTGLWAGDIGLMEMENMMFGTYQFMRNFKSVLEETGDIRHTFWQSWIGMNHRTVNYEDRTAIKVVQVIADTPAYGVLKEEDLILSLNGVSITCYDDFERMISEEAPNQGVQLNVIRDGAASTVHLTTIPYGSRVTPTPFL